MKKTTHLLYALLLFTACAKEVKQEIPVARVRQETFYIDLYETGEVRANQSVAISSPEISWRYGSLKLTQLIEDGKVVKAGDTVMVFDPSEVQKTILDAESRLEIHYAELEKLQAQQTSEMEDLEADYELTELSLQISKIQAEAAQYEANIRKKEIDLNLEKAQIALEQARDQIANRRKIQQEEMTQRRLTIRQAQTELNEAHATMRSLFVTSPYPGIAIIMRNRSTDLKYQIGDQVWAGQPILELPDLDELKAEVLINEVDIAKITPGMKVEIRPDAFSDSTYMGEVIKVANLAVNKTRNSKIKVFPVEVRILSKTSKLMPGLSVSCRLLVKDYPNATFVPLQAVFNDEEGSYVYVRSGNHFKRQNIETGISNTDFIVVEKGLKAGETVALVDPVRLEEAQKKEKANQKETK